MKRSIPLSIILVGFTAMASQIVLVREFLTVFYGNELSIGFVLASWLAGGAIGSSLLGMASDRIRRKSVVFASCQLALSILLPLSLLLTRSVRPLLNIAVGEIMPIFPMMVSGLAILLPICAIFGFMFSLACRLYASEKEEGAVRIGRVYMLEAIGASIGGSLTSFLLIRILDPLGILVIFGLVNIIASLALVSFSVRRHPILAAINILVFTMGISGFIFGAWAAADRSSAGSEWPGYKVISSRNSIYGKITLVKRGGQVSFFDNGLHLYTVPDRQKTEEAINFAMLEHPDPRAVLLIGGGVSGLADEVLKHGVERCDYVELDPAIVETAKDHLSIAYRAFLNDGRVSVKNLDARFFVKTTPDKYDCVIMSLGNPYTAQINRFYTVEFFRELKRILKVRGIVSFGIGSSESYMSKELALFTRSIYLTLKEVFAGVSIIPGEEAYFLASDSKDALTYDYNVLLRRAKERGLDLKYVREYYLPYRLSKEKVAYVEGIVNRGTARINYDFRPISYYYGIIFWTARFRDTAFSRVLKAVNSRKLWEGLLILYVLVLISGLIFRGRKQFFRAASLGAVMTTGLSVMAFQILILLAFQIIYGYLFYKLGLMLTAFMMGSFLGGLASIKIIPKLKDERPIFAWTQGSLFLYSLALMACLWWLGRSADRTSLWLGSNVVFLSLPVLAGFIGGFQFPLANKIYLRGKGEVGRAAGLVYGADLLGAFGGALITGIFLIPVIGLFQTCLAIALVNLKVFLVLMASK